MGMPSYFSNLSMFNAKKPPQHHHDMEGKTLLAFRRIVLLYRMKLHRTIQQANLAIFSLEEDDRTGGGDP
jgi:hypothetical protein